MVDLDQFENTAAWLEFCDGMSRFEAETEAARRQGVTRWQVMEAKRDAERDGHSERGGDHRSPMAGQQCQNDMPRVQRAPKEENRPMLERNSQAGWAGVDMLALRTIGRGVL